MPDINFADMFVWYVAFLLSFTAHEAAHAFMAMKGGDLTAYRGGQVTLNPIPHIMRSPVGTIVVPIISFVFMGWMIGWASAPYNPDWAARYPRRAALMAAAGPAANFIILITSFVLVKIFLLTGTFDAPTPEQFNFTQIVVADSGLWIGAAKFLSVLLMLNLLLFIFNLFPFPPLDGSSVITLFMSKQTAWRFTNFISQPMYSLLGIVIAWKIFPFVFFPVYGFVLRLIHSA